MVVDHATGEVLARVGAADYFDERRAGQVDMTQALRSPGSTLKPFIYGLGFEDGLIHPETLIEDRPIRYGGYAPENFDLTFQGTVTVRKALQMSLNVPAVAVLDAVGASRFTARLARPAARSCCPRRGAGARHGARRRRRHAQRSGDALCRARAARQHDRAHRTARRRSRAPAQRRLLEPVAAWYVGNVLLGTPPPENAAGGRIAFKTGTSYGYRDAWAVGFDGKRTSASGSAGRTARRCRAWSAAPPRRRSCSTRSPARRPAGAAAGGAEGRARRRQRRLPPPLQRFRAGGDPRARREAALRIMFPPNGARLECRREAARPIALKIAGGVGPLTVLVNGMPRATAGRAAHGVFHAGGPGFVRLTVIDAAGVADSVVVRLQ